MLGEWIFWFEIRVSVMVLESLFPVTLNKKGDNAKKRKKEKQCQRT
jgi:hypothetical protein